MERRRCRGLARACCSLLAAVCALRCAADPSSGRSWLKAYGYLLPSESRMSALHSGKVMQSAVATMQQFYGIPVTGVLDQTTIEPEEELGVARKLVPFTNRSWSNKRYYLTYFLSHMLSIGHFEKVFQNDGLCDGSSADGSDKENLFLG